MWIRIKLLSLIIGFIFFLLVLRSVKRNTFRPPYAVLWIGICIFLVSIPVFEVVYKWIAVHLIGILDARHVIYVALIGFLLIYVFYLTIKLSKQSDQIQELISTVSYLENKLRKKKDDGN